MSANTKAIINFLSEAVYIKDKIRDLEENIILFYTDKDYILPEKCLNELSDVNYALDEAMDGIKDCIIKISSALVSSEKDEIHEEKE